MRFGICGGASGLQAALDAGFDYVEIGASNTLKPLEDDVDLAEVIAARPPAANVFFPGDFRLYEGTPMPPRDYAKKLFDRAAQVGIQVLVVGSGGPRRAPDGMSIQEANARFVDLVAQMQQDATPYGIRLAPESLNHLETNVGNDLGALATGLKAVGCDYTADSYHIWVEWLLTAPNSPEPTAEFMAEQMPHAPVHVHLGDLVRLYPRSGDPMMVAFAKRLRDLKYDGNLSLECRGLDTPEDCTRARHELRKLFEAS